MTESFNINSDGRNKFFKDLKEEFKDSEVVEKGLNTLKEKFFELPAGAAQLQITPEELNKIDAFLQTLNLDVNTVTALRHAFSKTLEEKYKVDAPALEAPSKVTHETTQYTAFAKGLEKTTKIFESYENKEIDLSQLIAQFLTILRDFQIGTDDLQSAKSDSYDSAVGVINTNVQIRNGLLEKQQQKDLQMVEQKIKLDADNARAEKYANMTPGQRLVEGLKDPKKWGQFIGQAAAIIAAWGASLVTSLMVGAPTLGIATVTSLVAGTVQAFASIGMAFVQTFGILDTIAEALVYGPNKKQRKDCTPEEIAEKDKKVKDIAMGLKITVGVAFAALTVATTAASLGAGNAALTAVSIGLAAVFLACTVVSTFCSVFTESGALERVLDNKAKARKEQMIKEGMDPKEAELAAAEWKATKMKRINISLTVVGTVIGVVGGLAAGGAASKNTTTKVGDIADTNKLNQLFQSNVLRKVIETAKELGDDVANEAVDLAKEAAKTTAKRLATTIQAGSDILEGSVQMGMAVFSMVSLVKEYKSELEKARALDKLAMTKEEYEIITNLIAKLEALIKFMQESENSTSSNALAGDLVESIKSFFDFIKSLRDTKEQTVNNTLMG